MERRTLLAGAGAALSTPFAGCLGGAGSVAETGSDDPATPSPATASAPDGDCGPGDQPLSALLTLEPGDPDWCFDGAEPSLAVENERDEALTVAVDLASDDEFAETYELDPGERVVEPSMLEVSSAVTGTVRVGDEERSVEWPDRSCHRHAVALVPDGVEVGWLDPLRGPGDTQHDCYPGDEAPLKVWSEGGAHTLAVEISDLCFETTVRETIEVAPDESERIDGELVSGGVYEITADVEGGGSETYEFFEECWGVNVVVEEDGGVRMSEFEID